MTRTGRVLLAAALFVAGCSFGALGDDFTRGSGAPDAAAESGTGPSGDASPPDVDAAAEAKAPSKCADAGSGKCHFLLEARMTQPEAKQACSAAGAHLVVIGTAAEQKVIAEIGKGSTRWIGLEAAVAVPNGADDFRWITGEATTTYENWLPGDPMDHEKCAVITGDSGEWVDRPCEDKYAAICEYEP